MTRELVINQLHTSMIETFENFHDIDLHRYNQREKELISFFPQARKRMVKTSDFYNKLATKFKESNEILPTGCKYYKKIGNNYKCIVIEEPPRIRSIMVDTGIEPMIEKLRKTGKLKEYGYEGYKPDIRDGACVFQLSFPYVVFLITLDGSNNLRRIRPFFRLHPVTALTDYLFKAPLYNIPSDQTMCLGNVESANTMIESVENIIERFWLNVYNHDYSNNISEYQNSDQYQVHDYLSWMYFTQMDPMFIYGIKWVQYNKNISQSLNEMTGEVNDDSSPSYMFRFLFDTAFETDSVMIEKEPTERNISYSIVVNGDVLSVGDELLFEEKKMFLYSIVGNHNQVTSLELEYENGDLIKVPLDDFEEGYKSVFTTAYLDEAVVNGVKLKTDSIITLNLDGVTQYKKIKNLRRAKDGKIEAFIGSEHYLLDNIDFKPIEIDNIQINGKPLEYNDILLIAMQADTYGPVLKISRLKYYELTVNNRGEIILKFDDGRGYITNIHYDKLKSNTNEYNIVESEDIEKATILHYFDKLLIATDEEIKDGIEIAIIRGKGVVTYNQSIRSFMSTGSRARLSYIAKRSIIEEGTRLRIKGAFENIDFKIGDPIIYANWANPEDMLTVIGIESFLVKDGLLYVIAATLDKSKIFQIPMINLGTGRINIGVIRKAFSKCNTWSVGDKLKTNQVGVYNFPKKDTNSIVAFINVPGAKYPVALCSNLCTIWMNPETMAKFDRITPQDPRWKKLEVTEFDLDKIKWQQGDFFKSDYGDRIDHMRDSIYFVTKRNGTSYAMDFSYVTSYGHIDYGSRISKNTLVERKIRHGIIMPRFQIANRERYRTRRGYPNMLGGYVHDLNSRIHNMSDQFLEDF